MQAKIFPVILSGGSGTRLWPLSRDLLPKQLIPLVASNSLLAETARRVAGAGFAGPLVVCNEDHRFIVAEQLRAVGCTPTAIVLEPVARNTAPAVAAAAAIALARDPDALLLVLPSDHVISDEAAFAKAAAMAAKAAERGKLVTFGITPTKPETGYGYIARGKVLDGVPGAYEVERFVEKPDRATAESYVASGTWTWNSGMFLFPAKLLLAELSRFDAAIVDAAMKSVEKAESDLVFTRLNRDAFADAPSQSIDYALMEKTDKAAVVPADLGWSDVGSWSAMWELGDKDNHGNVAIGDVIALDTEGCYLRGDGHLIATLGLKDVVLVVGKDVVMAASKDRAQDVKKIVTELKSRGRKEAEAHPVVFRPWGNYETIDAGPGFQVKRITVKPGQKLSLQKHAHRAEHWVVVSGTARVTRDDDILTLRANMSTYIPLGAVHRLENPGTSPLELIEVQSGSYLGEDDIVRLSDDYGRQ
ncbi:mannose-1-phosphate guanylyltransferase/mannose-6-phosphate isomerase [Roseiterribacter gracilis]|uniref:mannose-1-phosphate guanylyltransferase n=1 Tax=Roseiterribacter gracilis TaxID=2812848 RepID=A0A8S8XHP8_9PROT|nr:xanthan biosynthesis protein XanB [Rhodospirillales bacterium TMPK1]